MTPVFMSGVPGHIVLKKIMAMVSLNQANSLPLSMQMHFPIVKVQPFGIELVLADKIGDEFGDIGYIEKSHKLRTSWCADGDLNGSPILNRNDLSTCCKRVVWMCIASFGEPRQHRAVTHMAVCTIVQYPRLLKMIRHG